MEVNVSVCPKIVWRPLKMMSLLWLCLVPRSTIADPQMRTVCPFWLNTRPASTLAVGVVVVKVRETTMVCSRSWVACWPSYSLNFLIA